MEPTVRLCSAEKHTARRRALEEHPRHATHLRERSHRLLICPFFETLLFVSQIALFSAIITAFYNQASSALSPSVTFETNQILSNLTTIAIAISAASGVNVSQLTLSPLVVFEPDASTLRLNFYWSASLILSVSVSHLSTMAISDVVS